MSAEQATAPPPIPTGSIQHCNISVSDIEKATEFYTKLLEPLGYHVYQKHLPYAVGFTHDKVGPAFWLQGAGEHGVGKPHHVAFYAADKDLIHKWHELALSLGAKDNGKPGPRTYTDSYYAAFILDADGNNIELMQF